MGVTIFLVNPSENYFYFLFLVILAIVFGVFAYRIMRYPHLRRLRPITFFDFNEPSFSNRCSVITSLAIALPLIIYAYVDNWQHFYSCSQESDQFYVHYLFPKRTIKLSNVNELQITTHYEVRRGASYRIKISAADRREYTSQVMLLSELEINLAKLNNALEPYRNLNIAK